LAHSPFLLIDATKIISWCRYDRLTPPGRRVEQRPELYTVDNFRAWNDRSRANLGVDTLDLVQPHCPPTPVYSTDAVFDAPDGMVEEGRIAAYGVSVETVDEALTAIARDHVASVQIILNAFRLKPLERVLPAAAEAGVGVIARVPLASGLLSGRYTRDSVFAADDHRTYNRHGEAFSGVDYDNGVEAALEFAALDRAATRCHDGDSRRPRRGTGPRQRGSRRIRPQVHDRCGRRGWPARHGGPPPGSHFVAMRSPGPIRSSGPAGRPAGG
jgi:aryl-alcohol dehydrogenase-like predicted oxidoreductase